MINSKKISKVIISLLLVVTLQACGMPKERVETSDTIQTSYKEWAQEAHFTEGNLVKVTNYTEYSAQNLVTVGFEHDPKDKNPDYKALYDELTSLMAAHDDFAHKNPGYFGDLHQISFISYFRSKGLPDINFMTAFGPDENCNVLGVENDFTFKYAEINLTNSPTAIVDAGCRFDTPIVVLNIEDHSNMAALESSYEILKAFPNAQKVIVKATTTDYDKEKAASIVAEYLPGAEVYFSYWDQL